MGGLLGCSSVPNDPRQVATLCELTVEHEGLHWLQGSDGSIIAAASLFASRAAVPDGAK